ncbi:MAG: DUF411 domain-containing protein [Betaproteobacteria bacterium]|nr:MAG: DUF411 domain-containing protein [Betaproteobacteria bacterium]
MRLFVRTFIGLIAFVVAITPSLADGLPQVEVWKDPNCGCCNKWIAHLQDAGFDVTAHNTRRVGAAREKLGMPNRYASCHVARIGDYVIEGHVPADDIKRLLEERPMAKGLAVPGMPMGSPGMEGPRSESYQTLLIGSGGNAKVFAEH